MTGSPNPLFRKEILKLLSAHSFAVLLFAVFVVFMGIKYAWTGSGSSLESLLEMAVYVSVLWGFITNWRRARAVRQLNAALSWQFFAGPRPDDPNELRVWWWTRQFLYALLAVGCSMGILVIVMILRDR